LNGWTATVSGTVSKAVNTAAEPQKAAA